MARPVLVTGAAGFAGSHLVDALARDAVEIVAWHRPGRTPAASTIRVSWQAVDLLNRVAVSQALADIRPSAVFHCAGAAHVGRSWSSAEETLAVNVRGTHHLIEGLRQQAG